MVVQHNLSAMNTNRQMGVVTSALQKSTEKLSSGYKINRAGDDAAGLSISEKMRSQIRGLNKAASNAQDGISLVQVAEGALNETHSILQRMNELATQAANDTNTSVDREAIQQEMNQLTAQWYQLWDDELNSLWSRLSDELDTETKAEVLDEQRAWIDRKEKNVKGAGMAAFGGSLQPQLENDTAKDMTRARTYILAGYLADVRNENFIISSEI